MKISRRQPGYTRAERIFLRRVTILVVLLGTGWLLFAPRYGYFHYRSRVKRAEQLAQENKKLQEGNNEKATINDRLRHDDAYFEKMARETYGLLKKNETTYEFDVEK